MQRFKNILLVFRESDLAGPAVQRALRLAKVNRAGLTVVDVVQFSPLGRRLEHFGDRLKSLHQETIEERRRELERLFFEPGQEIRITIEVLAGKPHARIIDLVQRRGCDLVLKAAEREKLLSSMLFGSTDLQLLRKCPCAVWIVKGDDPAESRRILAAVDLETFDREEGLNALNRQIVEVATSLAHREGSALEIVNAWIIFDGARLAKKISRHYQEDVEAWVEEQKRTIAEAQLSFRQLVEKHLQNNRISEIGASFHFVEGEAEKVIVELAAAKEVDLVVMGTVARSDLAGFLVGNTSEAVLSRINCSVLAVKPPGFVAPISAAEG